MDLAGSAIAIDMLARPVTLRRPAAGAYVNGRWSEGAPTAATIRAVLTAVSPADLRDMPEGQRQEARRAIWTRAELLTADEMAGRRADEIVDGAARYRVILVHARGEGGYHKAILGEVRP